MTPQQLRAKIRNLPEKAPITASLDQALTRRGMTSHSWPMGCHKQHWLNWLKGYKGSGYYNRKNWHRSAEFVYNHINCPPMVLWLGEASGIPKPNIAKAKRLALSAKPSLPSQSAAVREIIPWEMIEGSLDRRGRYGRKSSTRSGAGKKTARTRKLRATGQAGRTRRIHWVVESDELDNLGHGVQFLHDELQREKPDELRSKYPVAFLEGFNWREGSSETVRLLGSRPSFVTADHWPEIIESAREAVLAFLSNEGEVNWQFRHGQVYVLANA